MCVAYVFHTSCVLNAVSLLQVVDLGFESASLGGLRSKRCVFCCLNRIFGGWFVILLSNNGGHDN